MRLDVVVDHRFYAGGDGVVFSPHNLNYEFWADRFLCDFDEVRILARVARGAPPRTRGPSHVEGDGVTVESVGDWSGMSGFARVAPVVLLRVGRALEPDAPCLLIAPGQLASAAGLILRRRGWPYAVQVIGDPAFSIHASRLNPVARVARAWWIRDLRRLTRRAAVATYVTGTTLQRLYPPRPGSPSLSCSDVELPEHAFVVRARDYSGWTGSTCRIVCVASLAHPYKGVDTLISAVRLCRSAGLNAMLRVVGDGQLRPALEAHARSEDVAEFVQFRGQVPSGESVWSELDEADLFALASRTEGLPRAMIEAMARGLPCIATNVGGIPELLDSDWLVEPNSPEALAQRILEVCCDRERLRSASAGNRTAARRYSAEVLGPRRRRINGHLQRLGCGAR